MSKFWAAAGSDDSSSSASSSNDSSSSSSDSSAVGVGGGGGGEEGAGRARRGVTIDGSWRAIRVSRSVLTKFVVSRGSCGHIVWSSTFHDMILTCIICPSCDLLLLMSFIPSHADAEHLAFTHRCMIPSHPFSTANAIGIKIRRSPSAWSSPPKRAPSRHSSQR